MSETQPQSIGIKAQKKQKNVPFGVYYIHKSLLENHNRLSVKYPSGCFIKEFPSQIISTDLRDLLVKLIKEQKVDYKLLQNLNKKDSDMFYLLIQKARLDDQLGLSGWKDDEYSEKLKRFELLRGQILSGNNAPEVMKELKALILNFMSTGKMKRTEGSQILWELDCLLD